MRRRAASALLSAAALLATACSASGSDGAVSVPPPPPATAPSGPQEEFTVVATGDVLIHPALTDQAATEATSPGDEFDYGPLFEGVRPLVSKADLALCHLEVPLAPDGGPYSGYPQFSAPPELAGTLADIGYDGCSTASNHVLDQGDEGVTTTLDALDEAGIQHTGSGRTPQEANTPLLYDVAGVKVGHISFTFGFNGLELPADKPWLANPLDPEAVAAAADAARAAGADVVIASLHWGEEYQHAPTGEQQQLAKQLLAEDAVDLIIGHHAHVVQPMERIEDKWVAYGLGNSVARHAEPIGVSEEGLAARFRFARHGADWVAETAEYVPTLVELGPPIRLTDLTTAEPTPRRTEALNRTRDIVLRRGAAEDGLALARD